MTSTDIALWGPKGSGKTTFIHAFGRVISRYYSTGPLIYKILDSELNQVMEFDNPDDIPATDKPGLLSWYFVRQPNLEKNPQMASSAYCHELTIYDDQGAFETEMLASIENQEKYRQTLVNIAEAKCVIIMLDHSLLSDSPYRDPDASRQLDREKYYDLVNKLIVLLNSREYKKPRFISACVNKIDLLGPGFTKSNPRKLVKSLFNTKKVDMLSLLDSINNDGVSKLKFIPISSYDANAGNNPKVLDPVNVEHALFWLFETLERKNIASRDGKPLLSTLFTHDRLRLYKGYPKTKAA